MLSAAGVDKYDYYYTIASYVDNLPTGVGIIETGH